MSFSEQFIPTKQKVYHNVVGYLLGILNRVLKFVRDCTRALKKKMKKIFKSAIFSAADIGHEPTDIAFSFH